MSRKFKPYLPGVLALIADEVGIDAAIDLAKARGGRSVWIPKLPKPEHSLSGIVGFKNACRISKLLGFGNVLIPCGNIGGAAGRRARIEMLLKENKLSNSQIAAEVDVHIRTVERVSTEIGDTRNAQPSLF